MQKVFRTRLYVPIVAPSWHPCDTVCPDESKCEDIEAQVTEVGVLVVGMTNSMDSEMVIRMRWLHRVESLLCINQVFIMGRSRYQRKAMLAIALQVGPMHAHGYITFAYSG